MEIVEQLRGGFITTSRPWQEGAVEVFAQTFDVRGVTSATLAITALGVYEAELGGAKIGDQMFAPGYTYYPRDLHYQVYDVTNLLAEGDNTLRVYLGQGWYCGRFTHENKVQIYGGEAAVSWVLRVEQTDGGAVEYTSRDIAPGSTPPVRGQVALLESPYGYAGFYDGEVYFAEGALSDGRPASYAPCTVFAPVKYNGKLPEVLEERDAMVRLQEEMPVRAVTPRGDTTILDFGQNSAGVVMIDPAKMNGTTLTLRHGEILNGDGSLYTANLRKAKAETVYHKGTETIPYRPRFTYMGFRYVELSGAPYEEGLVTAYALYDEMERTGQFQCANPMAQKLYENQVWGQKSNYVEVPTDCPQRDERMGYTGDGHVFARTGSYNFDTERFWDKFLKDIRYSQMDNTEEYVAPTIPAQGPAGIGFLSMLGWGNAVTILPELLYRQYGTDKYLREQYESMKLFVECEMRKMGKKNLWLAPSLGDWLMLGKGVPWMAMHNGPVSNAFIVNDLRILAETAARFGKQADAERYAAQLEKTRAAYIKKFIKQNGKMKDDYQGAYIMALKMVLLRGELWNKAFAHLVAHIKENGMQTGFFSTEHILPLLAENGEATLAFDLLLQEGCPGWMYQIRHGATTTWERWDAIQPDGGVNESKLSSDNMVSFNHYAFGSVGAFYYEYILGIKPLAPGFEKIGIRPFVDARIGAASGSYQSRKSLISVAWKVDGGKVVLTLTTPAETEVHLPDGILTQVQAGTHEFTCSCGGDGGTA